MRTLFVLCTAVTVLQIFDVSITGISAAVTAASPSNVLPPSGSTVPNNNAGKPKITTRAVKAANPNPTGTTNPVDTTATAVPDPNDPATKPKDDDSAEAEPPKTIKESGKRVIKTLSRMASNRGVGVLNGFTGLLKMSGGAFNFFGNFLRDRSNNVKDAAKESLGMVSSFSDSATRGVKHVLKSVKVIGAQGGKEMFSGLQKVTKLGTNVTKLGGSLISLPVSITGDAVDAATQIVKLPSKLSKIVSNGMIKPVLSFMGPNSSEEATKEKEEEKEEEKIEEPPKVAAKVPPSPPTLPKTNTKKQKP